MHENGRRITQNWCCSDLLCQTFFNHITRYLFNIGRFHLSFYSDINDHPYYVLIKAIASCIQFKEHNTQ